MQPRVQPTKHRVQAPSGDPCPSQALSALGWGEQKSSPRLLSPWRPQTTFLLLLESKDQKKKRVRNQVFDFTVVLKHCATNKTLVHPHQEERRYCGHCCLHRDKKMGNCHKTAMKQGPTEERKQLNFITAQHKLQRGTNVSCFLILNTCSLVIFFLLSLYIHIHIYVYIHTGVLFHNVPAKSIN